MDEHDKERTMYENGTTARLGAKSAPRDTCRDPSFRLRRSDRRLTRMMIMNWKEMEMGFILHMNALTLCRLAYKILTLHNPEGLHLILTHRRTFFGTSATASEIQSPSIPLTAFQLIFFALALIFLAIDGHCSAI